MRQLLERVARGASLLTAIASVSGSFGATNVAADAPPTRQTIAERLDLYSAGDYPQALAEVTIGEDLQVTYTALATRAAAWIDAASSQAEQGRRRLVAATFALDTAGKRFAGTGSATADQTEDTSALLVVRRALVSWGGAVVTREVAIFADGNAPDEMLKPQLPVQSSERPWFAAAIALLEALGGQGLIEVPPTSSRPSAPKALASSRSVSPGYPLLPLALLRFPQEPRFLVAQAVAEERGGCAFRIAPGYPVRDSGIITNGFRDQLCQKARTRYERLAGSTSIGLEAQLRIGYIRLAFGDFDAARRDFTEVQRLGADTTLRYLSQLFTGIAFERDQRPSDAEAAYRAALQTVPRARSVSIRLASLLMAGDATAERRAAAAALMDHAIATDPPTLDPWELFARKSAREWPVLLESLRGTLR